VEPEPPRIEVKAEPKVEEKAPVQPLQPAQPVQPVLATPAAPASPAAKVVAPPPAPAPPATPPPAPPKPEPPVIQTTPSGGRIIPPPTPQPTEQRRPPAHERIDRSQRYERQAEKKLESPYIRPQPKPEVPREFRKVTLTEGLTVKDLAEKLGVLAKDLQRKLMDRGVLATINQTLD